MKELDIVSLFRGTNFGINLETYALSKKGDTYVFYWGNTGYEVFILEEFIQKNYSAFKNPPKDELFQFLER